MDLTKAQQQRKILVVDDNPDVHRDFNTILSKSDLYKPYRLQDLVEAVGNALHT